MNTSVLQRWAKNQGADARFGDLAGWMNMVQFGNLGVGSTYFVDTTAGNNAMNGTSRQTGFKTVAKAVAAAAVDYAADPNGGTTIYIKGTITESVVCATPGVRFIGIGTGPVQATWGATTAAQTATAGFCLSLTAAQCLVQNIKFVPPAYSASGVPSAIMLGNAGYTRIAGCRFQGKTGSYVAIYSPVCNSDNVEIIDNEFIYMNTAGQGTGILGVEAGGLSYSGWKIIGNRFNSCVVAINLNSRVSTIQDNMFTVIGITSAGAVGTVMTTGIDLSGTGSGGNTVFGNQLGGLYTTALYNAGASGDVWFGNWCNVTTTTAPTGFSILVPAS